MTVDMRFEVRHKACGRLADLAGIQGDLELCISACEAFLTTSSWEPWRIPNVTEEALAEFAIFRYCRTLSTDIRSGVRIEQIDALPPELRERHKYFKDLRDKHLAHSVNYHEENNVQATIATDLNGTLLKLGTHHSRTPAAGYKDIQSLKELAEALLEIVVQEFNAEFDATWDLLEAMAPEERIALSTVPKPTSTFRPTHAKRPKASNG